jgi:multidrug transporter EmrE-like cation transporter
MKSPIVLVALGGLFLTGGDIVFKHWLESNKATLYGVGLVLYIAGLMFLVQSFKFENIAVASTMLVIFNILSLAIASWFLFNEKLSPLQVGGICVAIAAIVLLELGK